ncbi:hypothetical protein C8R43DRAFT_829154, partial [Mycena crocata]
STTIPITDSHGRVIAVLGGTPRDHDEWHRISEGGAQMMEGLSGDLSHSEKQLYHCRAQEPYPSVLRGNSHGGGQVEPGELQNNTANTKVTDELLQHEFFKRLAGWANLLFRLYAPILFAFYQLQMGLLHGWNPSLHWNFVGSVFAACTFNSGPRAITVPHLDFGN